MHVCPGVSSAVQPVTLGPAIIVIVVPADAVEPLGVTVSVNVPAVRDAGTVITMEVPDHETTVADVPPIFTVPCVVPKPDPVIVTDVPG